MINEIVNDYVEYLKVDLTKEVILDSWFITLHISGCHVLVTPGVVGPCEPLKICLRMHCHFACVLLQEYTFNIGNTPYAQFLCHIVTWKLTKGDY
jgi:hypothetical protein